MSAKFINFITGKLAADALENTLKRGRFTFHHRVITMPAPVAALMTPAWIARRLPDDLAGQLMIPGGCKGALRPLRETFNGKVERGPADLRDLPAYFGKPAQRIKYRRRRLQIIAEVVDAPTLTIPQIMKRAKQYARQGASWIDLGCSNQTHFPHLKEAVEELVRSGFNVSVDSFNPDEMITASRAGARMFLSVNSLNMEVAPKLDGKIVVIPDTGKGLASLRANAKKLMWTNARIILDPILDPLCMGAGKSLARYVETRREFPTAELLMGVGNITELTSADNVGINALLAGICAELDITYALTTQVVGWNRDCVRELCVAGAIMEHAVREGIPPKHFDNRLLVLRDNDRAEYTTPQLKKMSAEVRDKNFRIFVAGGAIHLFNRDIYIRTKSADGALDKLGINDAGHAFYLGKELQKAETAMILGKNYTQDQPLDWGLLTTKGRGGADVWRSK